MKERTAFGKPISSFQNTKFVLAEIATEVDVTQPFIDQCVVKLNAGELSPADAAKSKLWGSELQKRTTDRCLQLFGGYGYMTEYPIGPAYADAADLDDLRRNVRDHEDDHQQRRPGVSALKQAWSAGESTVGVWMTSNSTAVAESVADLGFDYVNIDMQHGLADFSDLVDMMRALEPAPASAGPGTITCRVPWNEPGIIGRVLDAGAMGVIIPMVNTVDQAERAVAACRYAPDGSRSYGPLRAERVNGPDYQAHANDRVACIPMIETVEALGNLDAILDVPGIDAVYVGPADLSLTLGLPPRGDHDDVAFNDALTTIVAACDRRGIVAGIHANPQIAAKRLEQGFRMVTVTSDLQALTAGAVAALGACRAGVDGAQADQALY